MLFAIIRWRAATNKTTVRDIVEMTMQEAQKEKEQLRKTAKFYGADVNYYVDPYNPSMHGEM